MREITQTNFKRVISMLLTLTCILAFTLAVPGADLKLSAAGIKITIQMGADGKPTSDSGTGWRYVAPQLKIQSGYEATVSGTCKVQVVNSSNIVNGNFEEIVFNYGKITGGTFMQAANYEGTISGGTYNDVVTNRYSSSSSFGTISSGTFNSDVWNNGKITGGTFNGNVLNDQYVTTDSTTGTYTVENIGEISGGIFKGTVYNSESNISGGEFYGSIISQKCYEGNYVSTHPCTITGGLMKLGSEIRTNGMPLDVSNLKCEVVENINGVTLNNGIAYWGKIYTGVLSGARPASVQEATGNAIGLSYNAGTGAITVSNVKGPMNFITSAPTAPAKPVVKATAGNGSATLTWDKVDGATIYRIYEYTNNSYVPLKDTTATTFTKTGLTNGTIYKFMVRAYNSITWSPFSATDLVSVRPVAPLDKPVVKTYAGNGAIKLSWNKVAGATSYRVYQYINGKYVLMANTTGTSYLKSGLTNGTTYKYLVRAYSSNSCSTFTTADLVSVKPFAPLAKPVVKSYAGNGAIKLSWNKVPGATGYRVYQYVNGNYVTVANTSGTSFLKSGLKNDTTYTYLVRAYNSTTWSPFTVADLVSVKPTASLAKPVVKSFAGNGAIKLSWSAVPNATGYRVYQYVNGTYVTVATTTSTSYLKSGLKNGTTYQYLVRAYNSNGWSPYTSADIITVKPKA